jgi:hypothetical protein
MSKKFLVNIDLGGNQLIGARIYNGTSAPAVLGAGQLWYDSTNNQLNVYNGTAFTPLTTGGTAVTSLNSFTGGVNIYGTTNQITVTNSSGSITLSLPSTISVTTACATNFYGTFNGTATNATQLGGVAAASYALLSSANFTAASVGGNRVTTTADNLSAFSSTTSSQLLGVISDETGTGNLVFNNSPSFVTPNIGNATGSVSYATNAGTATTANAVTGATSANTNNAYVVRDASGRAQFTDPSAAQDAATKNYVTATAWSNTSASVGTANNSASLNGQPASYYAPIASPNFTTGASVAGAAIATQTYVNSTAWNNTNASVNYATNAGNATTTSQTNFTSLTISGSNVATQAYVGTASVADSAKLGGIAAASYALLSSANFTAASVGGSRIITTSDTLNALATTTSSQLAGMISDETGTGNLVFNTSPSFVTPNIGNATGSVTYATNAGNAATTSQTTFSSLTTTGDISIGGNVYISGSTTVISGSTTTISDPLLYIATSNPANLNDIGFLGHFTAGTYQHTGLFRQASTGIWQLVSGIVPEPTSVVDVSSAVYDVLRTGGLQISSGSTVTTASITSAGAATFASIVKSGGTSSQFLKADGSVDSNVYLTSSGSIASASNSASLGGNAASYYAPINAPTFTGTVNLGANIASGSVATATNATQLGGTAASSYALLSSANFTAASVGGNRITTVADKFTAHTAAVTSSELAGIISDETGTGALVFNNSPSFVTPNIGNATGSVTYATNSGSLGGTAAGSYALLASPSFTGTASATNLAVSGTLTNGGFSVARKYIGTITGNGSTASFSFTHNLGTQDVTVQVYQTSAGPDTQYAEVEVDIVRTSASVVTVTFATAPANTPTTYNVVIVG